MACVAHDWPDGEQLTAEGTPRCPLCRRNLGLPIGPRARRRARRAARSLRPSLPGATVAPRVDARPEAPEQLALDLEDFDDEQARQLQRTRGRHD